MDLRSIHFQAAGFETITKQRKTASSFRDGYLFDIFELSTSMLRKAVSNGSIGGGEVCNY